MDVCNWTQVRFYHFLHTEKILTNNYFCFGSCLSGAPCQRVLSLLPLETIVFLHNIIVLWWLWSAGGTLYWKVLEYSFIPATCIMDSVLRAAAGDRTWSPDRGQRPPLAKEAAIAAPDSQVSSVEEHCREHISYWTCYGVLCPKSWAWSTRATVCTCNIRSSAALMSTRSGKHWQRWDELGAEFGAERKSPLSHLFLLQVEGQSVETDTGLPALLVTINSNARI